MFEWFFGKRGRGIEEKTKEGFETVRKDFEKVGAWVKHLDAKDKQLLDLIQGLKIEISSIKEDIDGLREAVDITNFAEKNKQLFEKTGVGRKQAGVYAVQESVQTPVQTGSLYDILNNLTSNGRLVVFALLNAGEGMKLSYEDIARLLGKERSTIRGQINAIKQKSEGLIEELTEPSGKKRVFIREEVRIKLVKYAKVRVGKDKKTGETKEKEEKVSKEREEVEEEEIYDEK